MPAVSFFPARETDLLAWSLNFSTRITAAPTALGLTAAQATAYAALHATYASALAACDPNTRNKSTTNAKNVARDALKVNAKLLANLINGTATVTDATKILLGLNVRAQPQPVPTPTTSPVIDIMNTTGWTVSLRLSESGTAGKRGKPVGVNGANVFSFVGPVAPSDISQWKYEGMTGRVTMDVVFPTTVAAGARIWLTAFWFNGRKESGPATPPIGTNLPGGTVSLAA